MNKKLEMYGLYFGCPEIKPLADCPFEKYRNDSATTKLNLLEKLTEEETDRILKHHKKCLVSRIQQNIIFSYDC